MSDTQFDVSIEALRRETISLISALLNPVKYIPTADKKLPRDWNGLAELCEINGQLTSSISYDPDPTKKVLELWSKKNPKSCTIEKLLNFFEELDRFDIIDDATPLIVEDIKYYGKKSTTKRNLDGDKLILTSDDVLRISSGLEPIQYDAFVLYAEEDISFATELITTMESEYNLRFFVKDRDLIGGVQTFDAISELINDRCRRLIVILSDEFAESYENKFFLEYATTLGLGQRQRKVVPCKYKNNCKVPNIMRTFFMLDYQRFQHFGTSFWEKLRDSIVCPIWAEDEETMVPTNGIALNGTVPKFIPTLAKTSPLLGHHNNSIKSSCSTTDSSSSSLKPLNQSVKFNSMVNLSDNKQISDEKTISAGTSGKNLNEKPKRAKWLKNIFKHKTKKVALAN